MNAAPPSKYRKIVQLGRGGMSVVYLASRRGPHGFTKLVVIKELKEDLAEEPTFRRMFMEEARLAARLNHPNVVQTYEVGDEGEKPAIVMEYLEGQSLSAIRKAFRAELLLPMELMLIVGVLGGLEHAHELVDFDGRPMGLVHRDVSPHNVFVTYSGEVKLVDFGIAKAATSTVNTESGTLKGKVAYMAPEQARGDRVDARADLYSVGVMLWEALTGRRLWKDLPDTTILYKLMSEPAPSPRSVNPAVPAEVDAICLRALAADPARRFASAREFRVALEAFTSTMTERPSRQAMGDMVASLFSAERKRIRQLVEAHVNAKDEGVLPPRLSAVPLPAPSGPVEGETQSAAGMTAAGASVTVRPKGPRRRRLIAAVLASAASLLVLGGLVTALVFVMRHRALVAHAPAVPKTAEVPPPPAAPQLATADTTVRITVRAVPPDARVSLDGAPVTSVFDRPRDTSMHTLRVEAPGFASRELPVSLANDGAVDAPLTPIAAPGLRPVRPGRRGAPPATGPAVTGAPSAAAAPTGPRRPSDPDIGY